MIRFGPSGNSDEFYNDGKKRSEEAPFWLYEKGLNAYEYSFGRGVNLSTEKANKIRSEAEKYDIAVSVHAPYYINFSNPDDGAAEKSYEYIFRSCSKLAELGGERLVFHPATVGKLDRSSAFELCKDRVKILRDKIYENKLENFFFCPETMGKINQIGNLEEIIELCKIDDVFLPTIDFGHLNARTWGGLKTIDDFRRIIDHLFDGLGEEKTKNMHIHFSKVEYSKGGEVKHLTFEDNVFGPEFEPLAVVLCEYKLSPVVICESCGTQSKDALEMKKILEKFKEGESI